MRARRAGIYSGLKAINELGDGKFYLWVPAELYSVRGIRKVRENRAVHLPFCIRCTQRSEWLLRGKWSRDSPLDGSGQVFTAVGTGVLAALRWLERRPRRFYDTVNQMADNLTAGVMASSDPFGCCPIPLKPVSSPDLMFVELKVRHSILNCK